MSAIQPVRILIVDDEAAQMKALCNTLREHGYDTVGFVSPKAGLDALKKARFDLLLTDLMMPEMNGIELLQAALKTDPNLVGVMMTGEGTIATAVEAMRAGALDYILKPFKLSVILPVLSRTLNLRHLRIRNAELERRVRERTAELEAANRELEAFSFSVSHDLRAPLRAMDGFSNLLLKDFAGHLPPEGQQLLRTISRSSKEMGRLVDDLLRLARFTRQQLSKQPLGIAAMVREVLEQLRQEQGARQVEVQTGDLPDCVGDPVLLKQVLLNLLSNAFKFTKRQAHPLVEVGSQQEAGETVYYVRDNGAGFDMASAGKLFGPFERLHGSDQFEGSGIGLSIVQRIILRHGGRVWARGEVNQGATFYFTVPAEAASSARTTDPAATGLLTK
jgi:signal transduction histidine kinase